MRRTAWAIAGVLPSLASPAAAVVDVRIGTCTVIVTAPGTLAPSTDLRTLSTGNAGGRPGRVHVATLINGGVPHTTCSLVTQVNCFRVTLLTPTQFSISPPAWDGAATFSSALRPQAGTATLDLLSLLVLNGDTEFDVHLTATRTRGTFPAGTFQAEQTIRCE